MSHRVGTQYAKVLLYRTQISNFTFKMCLFHHETQQSWHIMSDNSKFFARSRFILAGHGFKDKT